MIYGVGPKTAKRIVNHFGNDTLDVFESSINRLTEVPGIAKTKLSQIKDAWKEHPEIRNVMIFLQGHGISTLYAVKIFKQYGDKSIETVKKNPYKLAKDIYGIGFFSADKVALSLGFLKDGPERLNAAIKHILASSKDNGHCYLTAEQIVTGVDTLLDLSMEKTILQILDSMKNNNELKLRVIKDPTENNKKQKCYYSNTLYFNELNVAKRVQSLKYKREEIDLNRVNSWLKKYSSTQKFQLSPQQLESVAQITTKNFSILTGGPGCGKTTTTKALVDLLRAQRRRITLCAPTGRAAKRMSEVINMEAKTIHRLLIFKPGNGQFEKNKDNPLNSDFVIVDECSMLDISLTSSLLSAISDTTQVLFIGDVDQLPAVGAGNVLKDIISSNKVKTFELTQVFRQASESSIISHAHSINRGKTPKIVSPFYNPKIWETKTDCLFIDSNEATIEQLKFIKRFKHLNLKKNKSDDDELYHLNSNNENSNDNEYNDFNIPRKFAHVDLDRLTQSETTSEELKAILKKIHPWSSLHYGLNASNMIIKLYNEIIPKYFGKNCDIQILSPMTRGSLGTINLNHNIQETYNPLRPGVYQLKFGDKIFRVGDRVIQKRNNYDLEVFNGDIGVIEHIDTLESRITIRFDRTITYNKENLIELDLAYAITIHKSQGSEFEAIIIPIMGQHFKMLFRNLIYTGLTRAKKIAIFVGTRQALSMAIKNIDARVRQTNLSDII